MSVQATPAGFWRRYAAYSLDLTLVAALAAPLLWPRLREAQAVFAADLARVQTRLLDLMLADLQTLMSPFAAAARWVNDTPLRSALEQLAEHLTRASVEVAALLAGVAALYFITSEVSSWQASPGKRWLGLAVTDAQGRHPGLGRVVLRFLAGTLSWLSLNLGHALAAWTPHKQALHDLIAGTRVVRIDARPWPHWAIAWLLAQAVVAGAALLWVASRYLDLLATLF